MKQFAIFLTAALFGVMGWLMMDARSKASSAQLQLELYRRQSAAQPQTSQPAPLPTNALELAVTEKQILSQQVDSAADIPPPMGVPGVAPITNPQAAASAPPPPLTMRQRQVLKAPVAAKVIEYQKEYGFVVMNAQPGIQFEKGMSFAIRREDAIIGRIKISEVEDANIIADLDPESVPPGVTIQVGDDVIQNLGSDS